MAKFNMERAISSVLCVVVVLTIVSLFTVIIYTAEYIGVNYGASFLLMFLAVIVMITVFIIGGLNE